MWERNLRLDRPPFCFFQKEMGLWRVPLQGHAVIAVVLALVAAVAVAADVVELFLETDCC